MTVRELATAYRAAHNAMRNVDGLQPQEAFDELLKHLFFKECDEASEQPLTFGSNRMPANGLWSGVVIDVGEVRRRFNSYVRQYNSWLEELWSDHSIKLTDQALLQVCRSLADVNLSHVPFDVRSAALREFLTPDMRRGLGIYLTPDDVVSMMVDFVAPIPGDRVYDPACGSGTFLIETLKYWNNVANGATLTVHGTDKSPRMMLLAELNLGHYPRVHFERQVTDAIFATSGVEEGTFDTVLTNPPFGVYLDPEAHDLSQYETCGADSRGAPKQQQSEVVFVERCLRLLKPGGTLGIIVPRSVLTNRRLAAVRKVFDTLGYIYAAVALPQETFAVAGAQTTTYALFIRRHEAGNTGDAPVRIAYAALTDVGFDNTGRSTTGNQLPSLPSYLREAVNLGQAAGPVSCLDAVAPNSTFTSFAALVRSEGDNVTAACRLRDIVEVITTGRTPARKAYSDDGGLFLVKVGNLSATGIDWSPRDRNFIAGEAAVKRRKQETLMLRPGDILLTSSAHNATYIGKKVNIVESVPEWVGGAASFVGEVMLVRPKPEAVDPYMLLAFLRMEVTMARLQQMVTGQTAHLHPDDVLELDVPSWVLDSEGPGATAAALLREEAALSLKLNHLSQAQRRALVELSP